MDGWMTEHAHQKWKNARNRRGFLGVLLRKIVSTHGAFSSSDDFQAAAFVTSLISWMDGASWLGCVHTFHTLDPADGIVRV